MAHHCHASQCSTPTKPELLMCYRHWCMVPKPIQSRVWKHYRAGQCDDKSPSVDWLLAAADAVDAVAAREGRPTDDTFRRWAGAKDEADRADDAENLRNLLLIADNTDVPAETIAGWSRDDRVMAYDWAFRIHINANDNPDVAVPPRPAFLPEAPAWGA